MADTKKSDTASKKTERSKKNAVEESDLVEGMPAVEDRVSESMEDTPLKDIEESEGMEPPSAEVGAGEDAVKADGEDRPEEALQEDAVAEGMEAEELAEPEDEADIADLEAMDGVESAETRVEDADQAAEKTDDAGMSSVEELREESGEATEALPEEPQATAPEPLREIERETVVVERKGAVVPGFLGGAIAAIGLLFAAPYVIPPKLFPSNPEVQQGMQRQSETIASLESEIATLQGKLEETASSSALQALETTSESERSQLQTSLETLADEAARTVIVEDVATRVGAMAERITILEKRPVDEAPDPAAIAAVQAYARELSELREAVTAQMDEANALVADAAAAADKAVQDAVAASTAAVAEAEAAAKAAKEQADAEAAAAAEKALGAARAQALVDIQAALENGSPYDEPLAVLEGVNVPEALAAASGGVSTLPALRETFTLAAREALSVSRVEASDGSASGRASVWIQNQLGVRALAPTEGDDPDAVLSRVEAALSESRLQDAIAELSALPEGGQTIMADWVALAATRAEALAAADELAASLATK